jgi:TP901 family phage tail tape measure protein
MSKFSITAYLGLKSDQFTKGLKDARKKQKPIMEKIGGAFSKVGPMLGAAVIAGAAVATAAVIKFGKDSLMAFASFEKGMKEVFTLMPGISEKAMGKMEDDVLSLAKEMGKLPEEVVPALYQAISAGVPKENVMTFLEVASKASIGGVTSLETAVDGLTGVINAYGKENMSAARASDIMFTAVKLGKTTFEEMSNSLGDATPLAKALGVSFEELSAALATSTGITGNTAKSVTGLKNMMAELGKKGQVAAKNFEMISGKSFPDFIKGGGSMKEALDLMSAHADKTGGSIMDLFGGIEAGQAALQLTGEGAATFAANLDEMANSAGASEAAFNTMDGGITRSFEKIKASIAAAMIKIGGAIAPMVDAITPAIQQIADAIGDLPWKEIGEEVAKMAEEFKPTFKEMVKALKAAFTAAMPLLKIIIRLFAETQKSQAGGFTVLLRILTKLLIIAEPLLNFILKMMGGMNGMEDATKPVNKTLKTTLKRVSLLSMLFKWLIKVISGVGRMFIDVVKWSVKTVKKGFTTARDFIKKTLSDILQKFKDLFPGVTKVISAIVGFVKKGVTIMIDKFKDLFPNVSKSIGKLVGVVKGGVDKIKGAWSKMTGKLGGWWSKLKNKVTGEADEMEKGITESMGNAAGATEEAFKNSSEESSKAMKGSLSDLKSFGAKLLKSAKGLAEDQTKAMQATLIKMGANAGHVMKLNGEELQEIFEKTGEKGKAVMAEYQEANAKQIDHMKKALEALGVKQSELVGKSNEEIRRLWIGTGEKGQEAYNGVIEKEKQLQAEQAAGAKSQVENQLAAANANVAASTKQADAMKPVVNAAKLSAEAVKKIGPAIEAATPPTEAYAKAIVEAAHAEDKLVARLAVQIQQGTIRMKNAAMYNMITTGTMKVMGVHLAQLRYGILYVSRMSQFAEVYAKALKSVGPELKDLAKLGDVLEKGKFSIDLIAKGLKFTGLLISMDTSLKSIDKSLKGKFINQ